MESPESLEPSVNWQERYNASHIVTVRLKMIDRPGKLAECLTAMGQCGAPIGDIRMIGADSEFKIRDVQIFFTDANHAERTLDLLREVEGAEVLFVSNDVLEIHRGGTIETVSRVPLETVMDLRMVYTPGVASVCRRIAELPEAAWDYTHKGNRIAIVTNGTAVLGLGDIGPLASLPVMEGKAAILAHYVGVSADPVLLDTKDEEEIIEIVSKMASHFGAIQLEDIAAPACFEIEHRLGERLDIPVFHDDQHGTATVCVAGLINALRRTDRQPGDVRAVVLGALASDRRSKIAFLSHNLSLTK